MNGKQTMRVRLITYLIFMIAGGALVFFALMLWPAQVEHGGGDLTAAQTQGPSLGATIITDVAISEEACAEVRRQPLGQVANAKDLDLSDSAAVEAQLVELMEIITEDDATKTHLTCVLTDMVEQNQ